ncbi:UDP-N-acetylmuramoyl-L-alanyl-D-glutamate--2,6-diaminopimelate ligase [Ruminococcaceae bacterium OttesenSCG-928-O06]|nr:UDP-N-acetylmuramoyl-L-alanyl-D-glutamate--2,6-diaminopimelate ligase [Ruminococcaceae bacterium OttesenSCG-928-O06]
MEYSRLLQDVPYTGTPPHGVAAGLAQDSRKVVPGGVFVCIEGRGHDGHAFAEDALAAGAAMVVSQRPLGLAGEVLIKDTRAAYAQMSQNFFGRPAEKLRLVAVTGTNGKTTVATVLKHTLENLGVQCGLIGSAQNEIGAEVVPAKFTTPEAFDLAALMARMVGAGCTHLVMEASSQALAQGRLATLRFALSIFTNLTVDHLDYHGTMEEYFAAKRLLFLQSEEMLANLDDEYGRRLLGDKELCGPGGVLRRACSFSALADAADFTARNIDLQAAGVRFAFLSEGHLHRVAFPIPGEYSVANALAAGGAAVMLGHEPAAVAKALTQSGGVKGRSQVLYSGRFTVIRDFAHTADGMDKLLSALRPYAPKRLVVLFGCAGDREETKRPAMAEAALRWGDEIFLTSDNPRTEAPAHTMAAAREVLEAGGKPFAAIEDRAEAVHAALQSLQEGDVLALCGKGHEDYQVMNGYTLYLDEKSLVEEWIHNMGV